LQGRIWILPLLLLSPLVQSTTLALEANRDVRIGVLTLFHPKTLELEQEGSQVISVAETGIAAAPAFTLNGEQGRRQLIFRAEGNRVITGNRSAPSWTATSRDGQVVGFRLTVPGKFHRAYCARLTIEAHNGELLAVAAMDRETAVASIVASELEESAPLEALKAQAVATRSFLAAGARHVDFDFCDTTHCQFLKSPPPLASRVSFAVQATQGLVIEYRNKPVAAMYSSRCGGHTRSLREIGMDPGEEYPYYASSCAWCRQQPLTWRSRIGDTGKPPDPRDERQRIAAARQWGWSAIPGSNFTAAHDISGWQLEGHSIGHSVGLCQFGAVGMAATGSDFKQILSHYYPNTALIFQK
jgi:stage II sporulation protein D